MSPRRPGWIAVLALALALVAPPGCAGEPVQAESCEAGPLPGTAYIEQPKLVGWNVDVCPHIWAYQGVGDLDGDDRLELVGYGVEEYNCPEPDEPGSGYCSTRAVVCIGTLDASPAQFVSATTYWGLLLEMDAAGDLDGDGLDDFAIGVVLGDLDGPMLARGRADLSQIDPFQLAPLSSKEFPRFAANFTGSGVTALVTAPSGELRVETLTADAASVVRHTTITGVATAPVFAGVGDVDGDGLGDIAYLGDGGDGWVLHGGGSLELPLDQLPPERISALQLPGAYLVAEAGDINGDGIDDLAVAVERGEEDHRVYVVFGGARGPVPSTADLEADNGGLVLRSELEVESLEAIGDFSGDGVADLVVETREAVHVVYGRAEITSEDLSEIARGCAWGRSFSIYGAQPRWTGDLDGDGRDDIAMTRGVLLTGQLDSLSR